MWEHTTSMIHVWTDGLGMHSSNMRVYGQTPILRQES